jgi:choline dehydrogenase
LGPGVGGKVLSSSRADDLDIGNDAMSVVDGSLKVYGVEHLRIADGSIMPRVTTGNTMAPCVIIGGRAADALKAQHRL